MTARILPLLLATLLVACGGDEDSDSGGDAFDRSAEFTDKVTQQLGEDGGFDAVVFALERGYSPEQLFSAIDGARLQADGKIADQAPGGPALGLVLLPDSARIEPAALRFAAIRAAAPPPLDLSGLQEPPLTIETIRMFAREEAETFKDDDVFIPIHTRLILGWVATGYSPEQAIEALIFGEHAFPLGQDCIVILDAGGDAVEPMGDRSPGNDCIDKLNDFNELGSGPAQQSAAVEDEDEPPAPGEAGGEIAGIYGGEMTLVQCGSNCDFQCPITRPWRVNVYEDGSIAGTLPAQARMSATECFEPLESGWRVTGTWSPSGMVVLELESHAEGFAVVVGQIGNGRLVLTLDHDPRAGELISVAAFDADLTKE